MRHLLLALAAALLPAAAAAPALAGDYVLTIKEHRFDPALLQLSAGTEHKLTVKNLDSTAEEFESESLDIEKIIGGGEEASFDLGPLDAGTYDFYGEFHEDSATGQLVVK